MELEILEGEKFIAWTHTQYKDITRFPARIKAAASALYFEGYRGGVNVVVDGWRVIIKNKKSTSPNNSLDSF